MPRKVQARLTPWAPIPHMPSKYEPGESVSATYRSTSNSLGFRTIIRILLLVLGWAERCSRLDINFSIEPRREASRAAALEIEDLT